MLQPRLTAAASILLASGVTLAALGVAACAGGATGEPEPAAVAAPADDRLAGRDLKRNLPERVETAPPAGERALPPETLLAPVLEDAATRSGLDRDSLRVADSWRRTWNDGSLGCPAPDAFYTQALVPGWQVLVSADAATLDYRLADNGYFLLCTPGKPTPEGKR